ncbi:MAG: DUF167 domain-containing protein [Gammaproteobacteria bacterium]|nr:DUF167 domain-containing protein [Gammaproteobacteria bacterium]
MRRVGDNLAVSVRVQPRASRNVVMGVRDGRLLVRTTAAPSDGKANKAVVKLLAGFLDIAPSRIRVVRGQTQRNKLVRISGPVVLPPAIFHDGAANGL